MNWRYTYCIFKKTLWDGSIAVGHLMRRRYNGRWQYRKLTSQEVHEYMLNESW